MLAWETYWRNFSGSGADTKINRAEAVDFVCRLKATIPLGTPSRVLDFGCGAGWVAHSLAPMVQELWLWDQAPRMLQETRKQVARQDNVVIVHSADQLVESYAGLFDVILVTSVIQYMDRETLAGWLVRWKALLRPGTGRLIISDIPQPGGFLGAEIASLVWFSLRRRYLTSVIRHAFAKAKGYFGTRATHALMTLTPEQLETLAHAADLSMELASKNLSHRQSRKTAMLWRKAQCVVLHFAIRSELWSLECMGWLEWLWG